MNIKSSLAILTTWIKENGAKEEILISQLIDNQGTVKEVKDAARFLKEYINNLVNAANIVCKEIKLNKTAKVKKVYINTIEGEYAYFNIITGKLSLNIYLLYEGLLSKGLFFIPFTIFHEIGHSLQKELLKTIESTKGYSEKAVKLRKDELENTYRIIISNFNGLYEIFGTIFHKLPEDSRQSSQIKEIISLIVEDVKYFEETMNNMNYIFPDIKGLNQIKKIINEMIKTLDSIKDYLNEVIDTNNLSDIQKIKGRINKYFTALHIYINTFYNIISDREFIELMYAISFSNILLDSYADFFAIVALSELFRGEPIGQFYLRFSQYKKYTSKAYPLRALILYDNPSFIKKELITTLSIGITSKKIGQIYRKLLKLEGYLKKYSKLTEEEKNVLEEDFGKFLNELDKDKNYIVNSLEEITNIIFEYYNKLISSLEGKHIGFTNLSSVHHRILSEISSLKASKGISNESIKRIMIELLNADEVAGNIFESIEKHESKEKVNEILSKFGAVDADYNKYINKLKDVYHKIDKMDINRLIKEINILKNIVE